MSAPDPAPPTALLIIDMINALDFDGGRALLEHALPAAQRIARLAQRARASGVPVIYANDNHGQWRSDFRQVTEHCGDPDVPGSALVELLHPQHDDYFVLKPKNSAFHATPLSLLLRYLQAQRLVLTGLATDNCVLATAIDAHMHDFRLFVPSDCVAAETQERNERALQLMRESVQADTRVSTRITVKDLRGA